MIQKSLFKARKAVKASSKIAKSPDLVELIVYKILVGYLFKKVVLKLVRKRRLPHLGSLKKLGKKILEVLVNAALMLPLVYRIGRKEASLPFACVILFLTTRVWETVQNRGIMKSSEEPRKLAVENH